MTESPNVFYYCILVFITINVFLSFMLWKNTKKTIFKKTLALWLFNYAGFGIQFFYPDTNESEIIISFGFINITIMLAYSVFSELFEVKARYLRLIGIYLGSTVLTLLLLQTDLSFTVKSLPYAISMSIPLLIILRVIFVVKKDTTLLEKFLGFIISLWIIHALDFTFLRMNPKFELFGWMATYVLLDLLGIILPAISIEKQTSTENDRLKSLVSQRTALLSSTLEEKELLLKILIHDIKNPLTGMKWLIRKAEMDGNNIASTLEKIKYLQLQIEDLVNEVRVGQMTAIQNLNVTSLLKSLEDVKIIFSSQLEEKNITIEIDDQTLGQCYIHADTSSLNHNVLSNFISNAIKFSPPNNKIRVQITNDDSYLSLMIQDFGQGMSKEMIEEIMKSKEVTSSQGTSGETGMGLGLGIARSVLKSMGATMEITSGEPNGPGTKVFLRFPLMEPFNRGSQKSELPIF